IASRTHYLTTVRIITAASVAADRLKGDSRRDPLLEKLDVRVTPAEIKAGQVSRLDAAHDAESVTAVARITVNGRHVAVAEVRGAALAEAPGTENGAPGNAVHFVPGAVFLHVRAERRLLRSDLCNCLFQSFL